MKKRKVEIFFVSDDLREVPLVDVFWDGRKLTHRARRAGTKLKNLLLNGEFVRGELVGNVFQMFSVLEEPGKAFDSLVRYFSGSRIRAREIV